MGDDVHSGEPHKHNSYTCYAHAWGCDCPDHEGWMCNPYYDESKCPDPQCCEQHPEHSASEAAMPEARA